MLERGADPNSIETVKEVSDNKERIEKTPMLSLAIRFTKNIEMIKLLLKHGADINSIRTVKYPSGAVTEFCVLNDAVESADFYSGSGCYNAKSDPIEIVGSILEHGADPNSLQCTYFSDGDYKKLTMLYCAMTTSISDGLVELLLKYGADAKSASVYSKTAEEKKVEESVSALRYAITENGSRHIVESLIKYGADPNAMECCYNNDGSSELRSMLSLAVTSELYDYEIKDIMEALLENGADVNSYRVSADMSDGEKIYAILDAGMREDHDTVDLLLKHGADPHEEYPYHYKDGWLDSEYSDWSDNLLP